MSAACASHVTVVGPGIRIAVDANQRWDVGEAIDWIRALEPYDPWWVEEPTSPDDVLGHAAIRRGVAPVRIATGEHVQNRVVFKQLLEAEAIDVVQIDAARVAGVNENVAILLLAAKFGVPVCPHAGGVGLCELVQHLSMFDYVAVSGTLEDRVIEYVDHLHEHFIDPVVIGRRSLPRPDDAGILGRDAARLDRGGKIHTMSPARAKKSATKGSRAPFDEFKVGVVDGSAKAPGLVRCRLHARRRRHPWNRRYQRYEVFRGRLVVRPLGIRGWAGTNRQSV